MKHNNLSLNSLLFENNFKTLEKISFEYIYNVEDKMDDLSDKSFSLLEPHWSAVNTGEGITSPFFILKKIFEFIDFPDNSTIIDLGSGHGHPSIVFGALNKTLNCFGFDIVQEKVDEANRFAKDFNLNNVKFYQQDLSNESFDIPEAEYYYLYNPVNGDVADLLAEKLFKIAEHKKIQILSLGGRDIKSFKKIGFKTIKSLEDFNFETLKLIKKSN